jgi:TM2 domain-containing membrane protein YozV
MKRTIAWIALLTALLWITTVVSFAAPGWGIANPTAYLLGLDDHWTRQRQKEDKTQTPLLDNATASLETVFS